MAVSKQFNVGLALGSGGPKGLAHIGVIKVLEENNIPINFISGSSIGAMVGGFYAVTKDIRWVEKVALSTSWRLIVSLLDPSFRQGLLGGNKVRGFIEGHIGRTDFKQTHVPLSIVATNIKTGDPVIIREGEIASAIRASISLPLVFKPIEKGNALLADGGLSLPVPVEVVRKMGAELVIAINLDADYFTNGKNESSRYGFYKIADNSIKLLRHNLARWNVKNADIIINPQVGNAHWGKFIDGRDMILAGEEITRKILPQLKQLMNGNG